jgi:hypothetical protein
MSPCTAKCQLNVTSGIVMTTLNDPSTVNKMQEQGLNQIESLKWAKAEKEGDLPKSKPNMFTHEDIAGRKAVVDNGTRKVTNVDLVKGSGGE